MNRRTLLMMGAGAAAMSGCASMGMDMGGGAGAPVAPAVRMPPLIQPRAELLQPWTGPYGGVPPWDQVTAAKLREAILEGIEIQRAEYAAIANNPEPPTFENTRVAMERAGDALGRATTLMGVMTQNIGGAEYDALRAELAPILSQAGDEITFNTRLFDRIRAVHETAEARGLNAEDRRLVQRTYEAFVRNGAALDAAGKAELGQINTELARAFAEFSQKVTADENAWTLVTDEARLAGLPDSNKAAARAAAQRNNLDGWAIMNTRSSVDPFLTFASDRALREQVWRKFVNRGDNGDANDTNAVIARIVALRARRARLLGFPTHAHWRMQDTMARTPEAAMALMNRVWTPAVARVREEVADMLQIARPDGVTEIEPWDYLFYAEKVRKARYDLDQNEIKPYFELNAMKQAAHWMAERLYGLTFTEVTGIPVFHPEVRTFEVKDKATGAHVGLWYVDDFARPGKRSGAWHSAYRVHETYDGKKTVLNSNNNNFVKAPEGQPTLISLDDARTLFHEFGHALHFLLSNVKYPSFAGTQRDFVEYPSQVHEHWVLTRPVLDRFARHYQTGEPMPQSLVDKIDASSQFNQGYQTVQYLSSALVDMDLHTRADPPTDIDAFERESLARIGMPDETVMRHRLPQFNHLFTSDAYSAGYYSYLWSEVMDADTWAMFEEAGDPFDPAIAQRFKEIILAPGNTTDRAEAYRQFRGRDPDVAALLRNRGFPVD
ncbi:M3 family metallopeptidase [Brevundimonas sp. 2R-24]|uniref:M3 family metallopeptidase n=1 Tax=Peiella sedimenti TaxID=3061083 RepID=A0ABT8SLC1_9CAUL|nr:M3 family metallopeptidase [Caulobacteraceae bacterium XZ-24]